MKKAIIGTYFKTRAKAKNFISERNRKWHRNIKYAVIESDNNKFIVVNEKYL